MDDLTPAEALAVRIVDRLDDETRDKLGAWLESEHGVYDLESVRELYKGAI